MYTHTHSRWERERDKERTRNWRRGRREREYIRTCARNEWNSVSVCSGVLYYVYTEATYQIARKRDCEQQQQATKLILKSINSTWILKGVMWWKITLRLIQSMRIIFFFLSHPVAALSFDFPELDACLSKDSQSGAENENTSSKQKCFVLL